MKHSKQRPFLHILRTRLSLAYTDNSACFTDIPAEDAFRRWIWQTVKTQYRHAEIGLLLASEEEARFYNRQYRDKDYPTNVLSFEFENDVCPPTGRDETLRGDLIICPTVVLREAAEQHKTPEAHFAHLTIHGTLHLMGYDHITEDDAFRMETLEKRLLHQLGYPDPYPDEH